MHQLGEHATFFGSICMIASRKKKKNKVTV